MEFYNGKDLARSFRTVRANTLQIAEDIPEDKYSFRPAEGSRSVGETLAHIAYTTQFAQKMHGERITQASFDLFMAAFQKSIDAAAALTTKAQILDGLRTEGETFAKFLDEFPAEALGERVHYPAGMEPPSKSRLELLLAVKEHEMHHRAQLMVVERMLGLVPHLTRQMQERMAQVQAQRA